MSRRLSRIWVIPLVVLYGAPAANAQSSRDPVALAVLPLPEPERAVATVMGYQGEQLVTLRPGSGRFICLTDRPGDARFQVACYHRSLEPYMARGRELQVQGVGRQESIERRWEEIDAGRLDMPRHPVAMHQLFGSNPDSVTTASTEGLSRLTVIYMAYATAEELGLPPQPAGGVPWLMFPGKPTAHIMISR